MDSLFQILNIPILQALGVILLIGTAERIGIPIVSILKSILKLNGDAKKESLAEMEAPVWASNFMAHYNDELTEILKGIKDAQDKHNLMEIENNSKLEEILKYGVLCRNKS